MVIATDSEEIVEACTSFGAEAQMTSAGHRSGTDRVAELAENLDEDIIVNTVSNNAGKGRAAIEWIVDKLGQECRQGNTFI